ncbi:hypothetical protein WEI85_07735 [Actinomycetes bacterium KLBMP 9797]
MEPEHHDPWSEGTQRAMERLMALGVLIEAGSRLAAENARSKANKAEQELREQARRELDARKAERLAAAEARRRAREWSRFAADGDRLRDHLAGLPLQEVARHWVQASGHADSNATAATVLAACEDDLRRRAAGLMDFYDQYRDDGVPRQEAMANAARDFDRAGRGPARRHGGHPPTAGALTQIGEELDHEITRLAGTLDPIGRARLLRNLEDSGWSAQSLAHIEALLDRAEAEHRTASTTAGTPDNPATTVDEHQAARAGAAAADGRASDHTADAAALAEAARGGHPAQLAAQSFPVPAQRAITAHPTAMPAATPTARPTQRRTR